MGLHRRHRLSRIMMGNRIGDGEMLCKDPTQPIGILERQMPYAVYLRLGILDGFPNRWLSRYAD